MKLQVRGAETEMGGGETGGEAPPEGGGEPLAERKNGVSQNTILIHRKKETNTVQDRILKESKKVLNQDIKSMIEGIDKLLD